MFALAGEGTITESQLHEGLAKLHIAKIRERKKKDREAQIDLFQDDTSAASRRSQHATGSSIDKSTSTASVASGNSKTSFVDSHYSFQPSDFQSAIHKFYRRYEKHTDVRLNPPLLRIPDGYLNRKFVRRALKEQLNIKLTVQETDALCHKLSYGTTDDRIGFTSDEMENPKLMFIGKSVKALVVRIANVVVNKLPNLHKQQMESSILVDTVTGSSAAEDYLVAEEKAIFTLI